MFTLFYQRGCLRESCITQLAVASSLAMPTSFRLFLKPSLGVLTDDVCNAKTGEVKEKDASRGRYRNWVPRVMRNSTQAQAATKESVAGKLRVQPSSSFDGGVNILRRVTSSRVPTIGRIYNIQQSYSKLASRAIRAPTSKLTSIRRFTAI